MARWAEVESSADTVRGHVSARFASSCSVPVPESFAAFRVTQSTNMHQLECTQVLYSIQLCLLNKLR